MSQILIVEDDATFAQIIEGFLSKNNYAIEVAVDLNQAFKFVEKQVYELLLIDYRLPDGTGLDLLKHVRNKGLQVPIIIMTSFNDVRTAVKSIQLGAFDYITKPINPDELLMVINGLLEKKEPKQSENKDLIKGKSEVSDDLEFAKHVREAAPLYIPQVPITAVVTSRIEKYRKETEEWLVRHNVMYSKLIMHPAATPEQRRQMNDHAIQKSEAYKSMTEANFFIESDVRQAAQIFKLTQRPVLCIDTMTMFK